MVGVNRAVPWGWAGFRVAQFFAGLERARAWLGTSTFRRSWVAPMRRSLAGGEAAEAADSIFVRRLQGADYGLEEGVSTMISPSGGEVAQGGYFIDQSAFVIGSPFVRGGHIGNRLGRQISGFSLASTYR